MVLLKKPDCATEITSIKNDYVTNTAFDSKINDLKSQHIADEVKKVHDKTKKNTSDILAFEGRLKQKEDIVDDSQREDSFARRFYYYLQQSYLVYECTEYFFKKNNDDFLTIWKSTGYDNLSVNSNLKAIATEKEVLSELKKDRIFNVRFIGNYFVQNKLLYISITASGISIYIVFELDSISNTRNTDCTIQNALFGAIKITKNTDSSKNQYEGYGICFDEGGMFSEGNINIGRD